MSLRRPFSILQLVTIKEWMSGDALLDWFGSWLPWKEWLWRARQDICGQPFSILQLVTIKECLWPTLLDRQLIANIAGAARMSLGPRAHNTIITIIELYSSTTPLRTYCIQLHYFNDRPKRTLFLCPMSVHSNTTCPHGALLYPTHTRYDPWPYWDKTNQQLQLFLDAFIVVFATINIKLLTRYVRSSENIAILVVNEGVRRTFYVSWTKWWTTRIFYIDKML